MLICKCFIVELMTSHNKQYLKREAHNMTCSLNPPLGTITEKTQSH